MLTKPCGREACGARIQAAYPAQLKRRIYCSHRCASFTTSATRRAGHDDKALMRACVAVQKALGVEGEMPLALVRAVRLIRRRAYQAGHLTMANKVRRAVKRGQLVRRSAA